MCTKSQNPGKITMIINDRISGRAQIYPGDLGTLLLDQGHLLALPLTACQSALTFVRIGLAEDLHGADSRLMTNLAANLEEEKRLEFVHLFSYTIVTNKGIPFDIQFAVSNHLLRK